MQVSRGTSFHVPVNRAWDFEGVLGFICELVVYRGVCSTGRCQHSGLGPLAATALHSSGAQKTLHYCVLQNHFNH